MAIHTCQCESAPLAMTKRSVQFKSAANRQLPSAKASNDAGVMTIDVASASLRVCFATWYS